MQLLPQHARLAAATKTRCQLLHKSASSSETSVIKHHASLKDGAQVLLECTHGQRFGANSTAQQKQQILDVITALKAAANQQAAAAATVKATSGPLQGDWRLLWTSEASVHGVVRGQLLGAPVTDIQQHIDLQAKRVTNSIAFGWLSLQLQASGTLTVLNGTRIYYSFDRLQLKVLGLLLQLPVLFKGGGWTDCVLLLDAGDGSRQQLRVMENSRRDTLVLQRI